MRIASWNVNSIRTRQSHLLNWLSTAEPDAVGLQETKVEDSLFPREAIEQAGYHCAISGQKSYNGVALLSRTPIEDVRIGFGALLPDDSEAEQLGEQRRVISGWVEGVRVLNLYVPNGSSLDSDKYQYKLAWLACLRRYLEVQRQQGEPLCMVGDFNIGLEDRDLPDPARLNGTIMASTAERDALRTCLGDDLRDAFRLFEPDGGHWSWWDYRSGGWNRDRGWRIDHLYICEELQQRALRCQIHKEERGREKPSDHAPVSVDLSDELPEDDGDELLF
ncbi:MAG: exodeoxyribonuclease III [Synechococcus sp.]|nr:exodeoxyribonuclease III [Synechococcus sp.]